MILTILFSLATLRKLPATQETTPPPASCWASVPDWKRLRSRARIRFGGTPQPEEPWESWPPREERPNRGATAATERANSPYPVIRVDTPQGRVYWPLEPEAGNDFPEIRSRAVIRRTPR